MKILWLSHLIPYPPKSGVLQRSYNLIRELSKYHSITLVAFNQRALMESMFHTVGEGMEEAKDQLLKCCDEVEFLDIPSEIRIGGRYILALKSLFTTLPYTINWLANDKMLAVIDSFVRDTDFNVVHFDTISLAPYISNFPDIPKVLGHHNIESHMMLRRSKQEPNKLKSYYYYQEGLKLLNYERKFCKKFDLHITCSPLDSARLKEVDPSLIICEIPNGVDIEYFSPGTSDELDNHLVFAGGLSWYPNKDAMLFFCKYVWPGLKQVCQHVVMNVVGESPPRELLDLAAQDESFRVHGFVDDVREYISKASLYICPIRDGGGTRLKLLDAFAMGKAVVAHPIACEGINVVDKESILLAETADDFIKAIKYLLTHREVREVLGNNARGLVKDEYEFTDIGRKFSNRLERLILS